MGRALLMVFLSGLVAAGCAPLSPVAQGGERALIRNGFVVPPAKLLLVDDLSVDCVIASEVFDEPAFHQVGVEATAYLRIVYPTDACPEALDSDDNCPSQDYVVGTGAARGLRALFIQPGSADRRVLRVGAGREMQVFAGGGATLRVSVRACWSTSSTRSSPPAVVGSSILRRPPGARASCRSCAAHGSDIDEGFLLVRLHSIVVCSAT